MLQQKIPWEEDFYFEGVTFSLFYPGEVQIRAVGENEKAYNKYWDKINKIYFKNLNCKHLNFRAKNQHKIQIFELDITFLGICLH